MISPASTRWCSSRLEHRQLHTRRGRGIPAAPARCAAGRRRSGDRRRPGQGSGGAGSGLQRPRPCHRRVQPQPAAAHRNELDSDIDPSRFVHRAFFNEGESRIEMHLISPEAQDVTIEGRRFHFDAGESLHTEKTRWTPLPPWPTPPASNAAASGPIRAGCSASTTCNGADP